MTGATSLSPLQRIALTLLSGLLLAALAAGGTYLLYHWQQSGYPLWAPSVSQPTAVVAPGCAQRIDRHFGDRLVSRYIDHHSSRHEPGSGGYVTFFRVDAQDGPGAASSSVRAHLVKCVIADHDGRVSAFEIYRL